MDWLRAPELQGLAAVLAILQVTWSIVAALRKSSRGSTLSAPSSTPQPDAALPSSPFLRIVGALFILVVGWLTYSLPWALLAFGAGINPLELVVSLLFFVLGAAPALGAMLTRSVFLGGFLGGALPLGVFALYNATIEPQARQVASPFMWFIFFSLFGGMLGALTGAFTVKITRALRLPLPL